MTTENDPIIQEIRESRDRHAREHGNDLRKIYDDLKNRQASAGRTVVSRSPKKRDRKIA
jgi:hypothetical protein